MTHQERQDQALKNAEASLRMEGLRSSHQMEDARRKVLAELIERPVRGTYQLTKRGKEVLDSNPPVLDNTFLKQFESFRQFIHGETTSNQLKQSDTVFSVK